MPGWEHDGLVVEICGGVLRIALLLDDGELNSVVPEREERATEVREQHGEKPTPPGSGATQRPRLYTTYTPQSRAGAGLRLSRKLTLKTTTAK